MYIKTVVLDGFKSYGQRTEITGFDKQFNAITGLNGSGKSNILDSVCFVLGITNLSQVRAGSLQDLIYKSGQAGINKATVSITFDNSNPAQCPPGFENFKEITITRQIVMGGKNKYMINGTNVPNKKVQDLFCSVQLNVNNPHFLIMQGRVTKVLNMKPTEILAMVEEAAGTRMYEVKRQAAQKTIEKKDAKLMELKAIFQEEISPKLEKLREERAQYLEYQRIERELEHMVGLYQVFLFFVAQRHTLKSQKALTHKQEGVQKIQDKIDENIGKSEQIEGEVQEMTAKKSSEEANEKLHNVEGELLNTEKIDAKANASLKSLKENITNEEKKFNQLNKNLKDDTKILETKEQELSNVQAMFEKLKENDATDNEAFAATQRKFEAISAGMEVNDAGEAQTLQEQLMVARQEAAQANTENKQAGMELKACQEQLKIKKRDAASNSSGYSRDKDVQTKLEKEICAIEQQLGKLSFSPERMAELTERHRKLTTERRSLRERIENFEARKPHTQFYYSDPEPNFNKNSISGVVCRKFQLKDKTSATALETAAGGRLYNIIVDTDLTSKKLLQKGRLQQRATFIPLNKIQAPKMDDRVIKLAQELVGKENIDPALNLISFEPKLKPAMEFIFGNVFICKDLAIAKRVTFHDRIRKKCVTLDGDVTDPGGTLSGGAQQKGGSILLQIAETQEVEKKLKIVEAVLGEVEAELNGLRNASEKYNSLKQTVDMKLHELTMVKQRLQQTTFHKQQQEIEDLNNQIEQLQEKLNSCAELEQKSKKKAKELEAKMKDSKGHKERVLKEAEMEMKESKKKAEKSRNEWKKREQDYETLNLEISELRKGLETTAEQIKTTEENIAALKVQFDELTANCNEIKEKVKLLQESVKAERKAIAEQNKEIQKKNVQKEKLLEENTKLQLEIQKQSHDLKKLEEDVKNAQIKEKEYGKKIKSDNRYIKDAENLNDKEGQDLERRIKNAQERKNKLGRTVNTKAQSMFEHEEKQYNDLKKKQNIVENDKRKLITTMGKLDEKKKASLNLAYEQVSKDFGSIFSTLLPGANAKLVAPKGKSILEGLEIKVSLGGIWKDSLTELSGGQRSLAALSLILAMLLFKPAPLYILDEVDAALDLSHTQNIGSMLKSHFKQSQFMIVSLKDGMFNNANVLYRTRFVDGVSTISRTVNKSN